MWRGSSVCVTIINVDIEALQNESLWTFLLPWEDDLAKRVGIGRTEQNEGKSDRVSYDASKLMADNGLANIHAAAAEIGACKVLGAYCYSGVWPAEDHSLYSELPDGLWSSRELEIKWRRSGKNMPVDLKDAEAGRLVLWVESKLGEPYGCECNYCAPTKRHQHTTVRILGGGNAAELWHLGTPYNNDKRRMAVPANRITPIKEIVKWAGN